MQQVIVMDVSVDKQEIYRSMAALPGSKRISRRGYVTFGVVDSMVHYEDVKYAAGSAYVLRSVKVNPTPENLQQRSSHISRADFSRAMSPACGRICGQPEEGNVAASHVPDETKCFLNDISVQGFTFTL
jgi:hypothetical protein